MKPTYYSIKMYYLKSSRKKHFFPGKKTLNNFLKFINRKLKSSHIDLILNFKFSFFFNFIKNYIFIYCWFTTLVNCLLMLICLEFFFREAKKKLNTIRFIFKKKEMCLSEALCIFLLLLIRSSRIWFWFFFSYNSG